MTNLPWVSRVVAEYAAGRPLGLLFDFDGSLAPLEAHPLLSRVGADTRAALAGLAATDGVTVGVISGRGLADLRRRVGVTGLMYAGSGGMHLDLAGTEVVDAALGDFEFLADEVVAAVAPVVKWFPGAWVERKPGCLAVHFRQLTPANAACLCDEVRGAVERLAIALPRMRVREVTKSLEIAPADAWDKGDAVDRILTGLPADVYPVYAGDGGNDAEAVARVNARGGLTVGVGPEPPAGVKLRVGASEAFTRDLDRLHAALTGVGAVVFPCRPGARDTAAFRAD
jgi:trehalose-phosphatase